MTLKLEEGITVEDMEVRESIGRVERDLRIGTSGGRDPTLGYGS
jgi:hypothetical protein